MKKTKLKSYNLAGCIALLAKVYDTKRAIRQAAAFLRMAIRHEG